MSCGEPESGKSALKRCRRSKRSWLAEAKCSGKRRIGAEHSWSLWKVASTFWTRTGGHPFTRHLDSSAPPCVCAACSSLSERLASWVRRPLQSCFWQRVQAKKDLPKVNRTTTQSNPSCSFVISLQIRTWPGARLLYGRPVKRSRHHAFLTRRAIRSVCQENEDGAARVLLEESRTCLQVGQQNDLAQNLSMPHFSRSARCLLTTS